MSGKTARAARAAEAAVLPICASAPATGCDQPAEPGSTYALCAQHTYIMRFVEATLNQALKQLQQWFVQFHAQAHGQPAPATPAQVKASLIGPGGKVLL